jgi:hypothetical protein
MYQYYKYIDNYTIEACPEGGYANGMAISNLNKYFNTYPEIALAEGYKPLTHIDEKPEISENEEAIPVYS